MSPIARVRVALAVCTLASTAPVVAENSVMTGFFTGHEPAGFHPQDRFCRNDELPFVSIDSVALTASGDYRVQNAHPELGMYVWFGLYEDGFDPARPQASRVQQQSSGTFALLAGRDYVLVVSPYCARRNGHWSLVFQGPGRVMAPTHQTSFDSINEGRFDGSEPQLHWSDQSLWCGPQGGYRASDPVRLLRSGQYYFSDLSVQAYDSRICLYVYRNAFDPSRPEQNLVAKLTDEDSVHLDRDDTYVLVVQLDRSSHLLEGDEYFYLLTAEASFRMNPAITGNWFDPSTPGQGFFIDFMADTDEAFVGWFTFELPNVDTGDTPFGSGGHRWLTAFGRVAESDPGSLELEIELSRGGRFVQSSPAVSQQLAGTMTVAFADCDSGMLHYAIRQPALSGQVPIRRVSDARSSQCRDAFRGPGYAGGIIEQ